MASLVWGALDYVWWALGYPTEEEAPRDDSQETTTDQNIDDVAIPELPKQSLSIPEPKLEHAVSAPALHADIENVDDNTPCANTAKLSPEKDNILKVEKKGRPAGKSISLMVPSRDDGQSLSHITKDRAKPPLRRRPTDLRLLNDKAKKLEEQSLTRLREEEEKKAGQMDDESSSSVSTESRRPALRPTVSMPPGAMGFGKIDLGAIKLKKVQQ